MQHKCLDLFCTFAKIGLFTFGGGYAMIPLIQRECAQNKKWVSEEEILDVVAIAESTPGPIAINAATFIGRSVAGFWGALAATAGVVLPSFVIIALLSYALEAFSRVRAVRYAFWGIRAGVTALILKALWSLFKQCKKDWFAITVMLLALVCSAVWQVSTVLIILCAAVLGILYSMARRAKS